MKKICEWIVNRRHMVFGIMTALVILCGFLMLRVETTSDMTRFLSNESSMKQGVDLLEEQFPDMENQNTIRVMFKGLSEKEGDALFEELEDIQYVSDVTYESDNEDYVKDPYRLYILTMKYDYESAEEDSIMETLHAKYADYDMQIKDDNPNSSELPGPAILTAIGILVLIMIAMCGSWIEPIFFFLAIGFAVVLNLGTNIFMDYIANVTFAIAAILQLVLSMDYSIILSNRFRQERLVVPDKNEAMVSAMVKAFPSICSSSLTTFVGLLCLVFMSFKIGPNIGIVLAKGVICSLVCVMTLLPIFLLTFDHAIQKTAKKPINVPTDKLAAFSYRFRKPILIAFLLLFAGAYFAHNYTETTYTLEYEDPIANVFEKTNPVIAVYDNKDEKGAEEIADRIEKDPKVKDVLSYYTTLGKEYTAKKMETELKDMADDKASTEDMNEETLKMIYYTYHSGELHPITLPAFADFLNDEVIGNDNFEDFLDDGMEQDIRDMRKFTSKENLTAKKTIAGLADFFDMNRSDVKDLLVYYYTENGGIKTGKMTPAGFASFAEEISRGSKYGDMVSRSDAKDLKQLKTFTDKEAMTKKRSASSAAEIIGMDKSQADLLYVYSYAQNEKYTPPSVTLESFVQFLNGKVLKNKEMSAQITDEQKAQLQMLAAYTDTKTITSPIDAAHLGAMFGMETDMASQLLMMSGVETMSPYDFAGVIVSMQPDNAQVQQLKGLMDASLSGQKMSISQMSQILGMKEPDLKVMYAYYDYLYGDTAFRMSVQEVIEAALRQSDSAELQRLKKIIDASVEGKKLEYSDMASLLGMKKSDSKSLYILHAAEHGDTSAWGLSPAAFITFLNDDVLHGEYSDMIEASQADDLAMAKEMVDAVLSDKEFAPKGLVDMFGSYSEDMTENSMELLYLLHGSHEYYKPWWKMNLDTLFTYISDELVNDKRFDEMLTDEFRKDIDEYSKDIDDGRDQLVGPDYSIMQIVTTYPQEGTETENFMNGLEKDFGNLSGDYHLIGNMAMNHEMSKTFDHEMLLITLLTALAIFVVVMFTFRSLAIPAILVLLVQCGVFLTVSYIGASGNSIYYLAMLIVQCILMGATIDYAILFTNYYRENRGSFKIKEAVKNAYRGSIHTIMTSGLIICICTFILSYTYGDPSVEQICRTISIGAFCAITLILFVLPGVLCCMDRLIMRKQKEKG